MLSPRASWYAATFVVGWRGVLPFRLQMLTSFVLALCDIHAERGPCYFHLPLANRLLCQDKSA